MRVTRRRPDHRLERRLRIPGQIQIAGHPLTAIDGAETYLFLVPVFVRIVVVFGFRFQWSLIVGVRAAKGFESLVVNRLLPGVVPAFVLKGGEQGRRYFRRVFRATEAIRNAAGKWVLRIPILKHVAGLVPATAQDGAPLAGGVPGPFLHVARHVIDAERCDTGIGADPGGAFVGKIAEEQDIGKHVESRRPPPMAHGGERFSRTFAEGGGFVPAHARHGEISLFFGKSAQLPPGRSGPSRSVSKLRHALLKGEFTAILTKRMLPILRVAVATVIQEFLKLPVGYFIAIDGIAGQWRIGGKSLRRRLFRYGHHAFRQLAGGSEREVEAGRRKSEYRHFYGLPTWLFDAQIQIRIGHGNIHEGRGPYQLPWRPGVAVAAIGDLRARWRGGKRDGCGHLGPELLQIGIVRGNVQGGSRQFECHRIRGIAVFSLQGADLRQRHCAGPTGLRIAVIQPASEGRHHDEAGRDRRRRRLPPDTHASRPAQTLQRLGKLLARSVASHRILLKAPVDDPRDGLGNLRPHGARLRWRFPQHLAQDGERRIASEGSLAGEHFVEGRARGKDVGARIHRLAFRLFRRHIRGRPHDGVGHRDRCGGHGAVAHRNRGRQLRQSKIEDLDDALVRHDDVGRLDVPVYDLGGVRGGEGRRDLAGVVQGLVNRQRLRRQHLREVAAGRKLHDDAVSTRRRLQLVNLDNVGVVERRSRSRFLQEAQPFFLTGMPPLAQNLDGHKALQPGVLGLIDFAHAALAELFEDAVRANLATSHANSGFHRNIACQPAQNHPSRIYRLESFTGLVLHPRPHMGHLAPATGLTLLFSSMGSHHLRPQPPENAGSVGGEEIPL